MLSSLKHYLQGNQNYNFIQANSKITLDLHTEMKAKYPIITNILINLARKTGNIDKAVADLLISVVKHTESVFKSCQNRTDEDYFLRTYGEIESEAYPNFPLKTERAIYDKLCKIEDIKTTKEMCEKDFPQHSYLTPGLLVMTCACPKKVVYGISMMMGGESPQMIFDKISF